MLQSSFSHKHSAQKATLSSGLVEQLNNNARSLLEAKRSAFEALGIESKLLVNGAEVLDFGQSTSATSGELLSKICMGDLADANLETVQSDAHNFIDWVEVKTKHPLVACMAAQYAGWPLSVEKYFAMCSGPARSARGKEACARQSAVLCCSDLKHRWNNSNCRS